MSNIFDSTKIAADPEAHGAEASFEEKSVWLTLLGLLGTFAVYFFLAGRMMAAGVTAVGEYVPLFAGAVAALIVLLVAAHVAVAIANRPEGRDERDQLIGWRAENRSSWVLAAGVVMGIFALALPIERVWIANGLLLALCLAEVLKSTLQIYYYRRGL